MIKVIPTWLYAIIVLSIVIVGYTNNWFTTEGQLFVLIPLLLFAGAGIMCLPITDLMKKVE